MALARAPVAEICEAKPADSAPEHTKLSESATDNDERYPLALVPVMFGT